jgi:hypothetical protein
MLMANMFKKLRVRMLRVREDVNEKVVFMISDYKEQ